jgi:DNA (cytosine-5)-methyltransferase 1
VSEARSLSSKRRPVLIDLFCCQGGAGKGYADAGFQVVGIDIKPQPRYPFVFGRADVLSVLDDLIRGVPVVFGSHGAIHRSMIAAVHASPPCQHDSDCQRIQGNDHPDLIAATRDRLLELGVPYVIENVRGAVPKLIDPVMICGPMVGVEMYRHRYFETNWPLEQLAHPPHVHPQVKMGRSPNLGEYIQAVGNFSGVQQAREVMGMPWANREGLREAIPPAYTSHVGRRLLEHINADRLELADAA